jgi:hypothetical protein
MGHSVVVASPVFRSRRSGGSRTPVARSWLVATIFAVVGEHQEDSGFLLLLAEDGNFYGLHDDAPEAPPVPVEPDSAWVIEVSIEAAMPE